MFISGKALSHEEVQNLENDTTYVFHKGVEFKYLVKEQNFWAEFPIELPSLNLSVVTGRAALEIIEAKRAEIEYYIKCEQEIEVNYNRVCLSGRPQDKSDTCLYRMDHQFALVSNALIKQIRALEHNYYLAINVLSQPMAIAQLIPSINNISKTMDTIGPIVAQCQNCSHTFFQEMKHRIDYLKQALHNCQIENGNKQALREIFKPFEIIRLSEKQDSPFLYQYLDTQALNYIDLGLCQLLRGEKVELLVSFDHHFKSVNQKNKPRTAQSKLRYCCNLL